VLGCLVLAIVLAVGAGYQLRRSGGPDASPASAVAGGDLAGSPAAAPAPTTVTTRAATTSTRGATTSTRPARTAAPGSTTRGPSHFATLAAGAALPSGTQCATWVRARPLPERKRVNRPYNQATGHRVSVSLFDPGSTDPRAAALSARIDGAFTGTTQEILRWAACKWGIDESLVFAQAAMESWWRQTTLGDWGSDPSACPPGHALDADGRAGQCPQSFGILQNRYPFERATWPGIQRSTAMNADAAYANWRACFEGYEHWLNDVERGRQYTSGDAWGCIGRWFSGRWHTDPGDQYVTKVKDYLAQRIWESRDFQEV
jgi:autotransporter family porin